MPGPRPLENSIQAQIAELDALLRPDGYRVALRSYDPQAQVLVVELAGYRPGCTTAGEAAFLLVQRRLQQSFPQLQVVLV